jgi:hypothetical protein
MPGGGLGRMIRSRDCVAGTPKDSHLPDATQRGRAEGLARGTSGVPMRTMGAPREKK